jgi:hypothetical protein
MAQAKTSDLQGLEWPTPARDLKGGGVPISLDKLLQSLQLVATDDDRDTATAKSWKEDTPASMQVIKSGALGITKNSIAWVGSVGGITGAVTAITGVLTAFIGDVGEPVTIALIASAALLLSAVAVALALFVKGDLEARGVATAARHRGRAEVAAAFLEATGSMAARNRPDGHETQERTLLEDFFEALRAHPDEVRVTTANKPTPVVVNQMWRLSSDDELRLSIGSRGSRDEITLSEITGFTTASP